MRLVALDLVSKSIVVEDDTFCPHQLETSRHGKGQLLGRIQRPFANTSESNPPTLQANRALIVRNFINT